MIEYFILRYKIITIKIFLLYIFAENIFDFIIRLFQIFKIFYILHEKKNKIFISIRKIIQKCWFDEILFCTSTYKYI